MAKFPSREDTRDVGLWELLTYQLSIDAGIVMPSARSLRLSDRGNTYAVKRFDRMEGFNVLIGNRDDHLGNHGFLREGNGWRLSPAFGVNPNPDKQHHVLAIDDADTSPDTALLMTTADYYRLDIRRATEISGQVRNAVKGWEKHARKLGIKSPEIELMDGVINPDR